MSGACVLGHFTGMTHDEQDIDLPGQFNSIEVINAQLGTVGKTQGKESSTPDAAMLSQQIQEVVHRCHLACSECLQLLCSLF